MPKLPAYIPWILALLICLALRIPSAARAGQNFPDYGQCARRCAKVYGSEATGRRKGLSQTCRCSRGKEVLEPISRLNSPEAVPAGSNVCGTDGITYPDQVAAERVTRVLHAGFCGQCSSDHDIALYRETRQTLTRTSTQCATRNLLFGRKAADRCFRRVGFSEGCSRCWVDNMACDAAQCVGVCLKAKLLGTPNNVDGRLNDCLACDERYCGADFIRCAGVNRRRAGILSDIGRPSDQVWQPAPVNGGK